MCCLDCENGLGIWGGLGACVASEFSVEFLNPFVCTAVDSLSPSAAETRKENFSFIYRRHTAHVREPVVGAVLRVCLHRNIREAFPHETPITGRRFDSLWFFFFFER